jgi:hypothetical protein
MYKNQENSSEQLLNEKFNIHFKTKQIMTLLECMFHGLFYMCITHVPCSPDNLILTTSYCRIHGCKLKISENLKTLN